MSDAVLVSRPAPGLPAQRFPWRMAIAVAALCAALAVLLAAAIGVARLDRVVPDKVEAARPGGGDWVEVPRPVHVFALEAPLLRGIEPRYSARRRPDVGSREDLLVFGTPSFDSPAVRLRMRRHADGEAPAPSAPLFAAAAREAAEAGFSVAHAGLADLMASRFGAVEVVDLLLSDGTAAPVPCTAFRLPLDRPAFTIGGLACGALGQPIERAALACLLDRVDLASGGGDEAATAIFAATNGGHDAACAEPPPPADGHRATATNDKPATRSKSSRRH